MQVSEGSSVGVVVGSTGVVMGAGVSVICPDVGTSEVLLSSQQPQKRPGVRHVVDDGGTVLAGSVVVISSSVVVVVVVVVVVLSLHPNHPGVSHVDVELELLVVVASPVVVVSSKHPHHPGVLHVSVLVLVELLVDDVDELVIGSVPLLSYIFQFAQSLHSGVNLHSGTSSYFMMTSWMTERILCVPMPTRHPLSPTVS
jgi:hypothetical protein